MISDHDEEGDSAKENHNESLEELVTVSEKGAGDIIDKHFGTGTS